MQNLYIKIPDGANVVIDKLYENGHSAFVVGGCVRDFILEKEPHDWDICTDALPEQVMQIFGEKNVIPTGIKHGTVTVLIGNDNYEVTTYRIDGMYSDGRRPDNVEFTQNLIILRQNRYRSIHPDSNSPKYSPLQVDRRMFWSDYGR